MHSGKIRIEQALTPIPLFTIMENTSYVIQGLTLLTESLDLPNIISRYLPVNFDTISRATLLFENLRSLVQCRQKQGIKNLMHFDKLELQGAPRPLF